jgi:hypothetical protein
MLKSPAHSSNGCVLDNKEDRDSFYINPLIASVVGAILGVKYAI